MSTKPQCPHVRTGLEDDEYVNCQHDRDHEGLHETIGGMTWKTGDNRDRILSDICASCQTLHTELGFCTECAKRVEKILGINKDNKDWGDKPIPEDDAIEAAHPLRNGRHDLYAEAMRLVGAKHSKYALVDLVNWLLHRIEWRDSSKT